MKKLFFSLVIVMSMVLSNANDTFGQSGPFIGEVRMFAGNFAPRGWALCQGQLLSINQNQALFSIIGTTYGGDGRTSFALPDLRGRTPVQQGNGPGLSTIRLGQRYGQEQKTLTINEIPPHTHGVKAYSGLGNESTPAGRILAATGAFDKEYSDSTTNLVDMKNTMITPTGGGQQFPLSGPRFGINYIICLQGTFPSRN